jgi:predicted transcriptional regulator of viral defense system
MKLQDYIYDCLRRGKYFFTKKKALTEVNLSETQFYLQSQRLYRKKVLQNLGHDFFMIIPAEYQNMGSLPSHWIIDIFMGHLKLDYYIGLLSAASLYGATEQQPMVFQVITNKKMRNAKLNQMGIEFHVYKYCALATKTQITVPTGYAKVATKEQTLVDMVRFYKAAGYLSNSATVIRDLHEQCKPAELAKILVHERVDAVLQRLGYILQFIKADALAKVVEQELRKRKIRYILLRPDYFVKKGEKVERWKIILNDTLEVEI